MRISLSIDNLQFYNKFYRELIESLRQTFSRSIIEMKKMAKSWLYVISLI